jgi:transposase-like protein
VYKPRRKMLQTKTRIAEFIVDETLFKLRNEYVWVWVAIDSTDKKQFLAVFVFLLKELCLLQNAF